MFRGLVGGGEPTPETALFARGGTARAGFEPVPRTLLALPVVASRAGTAPLAVLTGLAAFATLPAFSLGVCPNASETTGGPDEAASEGDDDGATGAITAALAR